MNQVNEIACILYRGYTIEFEVRHEETFLPCRYFQTVRACIFLDGSPIRYEQGGDSNWYFSLSECIDDAKKFINDLWDGDPDIPF